MTFIDADAICYHLSFSLLLQANKTKKYVNMSSERNLTVTRLSSRLKVRSRAVMFLFVPIGF